MGKTFSQQKTNVGSQVQDTSSALATKIGVWLNDKYRDIWRRVAWPAVTDDDYTFESVTSQVNYDLPSDFEEELFMANIAQGYALKRQIQGARWRDRTSAYQADSIPNGTPHSYDILPEVINSSGVPLGVIRLDPPPAVAETYAMPYKRRHVDLLGTTGTCDTDTASKIIASASTFITDLVQPGMRVKNTTDTTYGYVTSVDSETQLTMDTDLCPDGDETFTISNETLIPDIEWMMELGAIGEAWAYKRDFAKANYYLNRYEIEVRRRIGQERSKINQRYQNVSESFRSPHSRHLLGEQSYDTV